MRNSLSGPRGKPLWKQSGKPLAMRAMPPAKPGSEKADEIVNRQAHAGRWATATITRRCGDRRPHYAKLSRPFGFLGQKVERPADLPRAIRNAMREVEPGKTAIL